MAGAPDRRMVVGVAVGAAAVLVVLGVLGAVLLARSSGGDDVAAPPGATSAVPTTATTTVPVPATGPTTFDEGSVTDGVRTQTGTVQDGIIQRPFTVLSPSDTTPGERLPVVVVLHGLGVSSGAMSQVADWRGAVARDRFVAVFPQGVLDSWNAGPCCPPASLLGTNDLAYLDEVVRQLDARGDVDPSRRYLTGFSNGGVMAYAVACARPDVFAAVAPMAGSNLTGCEPDRPVSLLHQHGDPDLVVPYDGRPTLSQILSSAPFPPVPDSVAAWAASAGCEPGPEVRRTGAGVTRETWSGCGSGARVELLTYPGNEHRWPTGPTDGLDEVLRFFGIRN